ALRRTVAEGSQAADAEQAPGVERRHRRVAVSRASLPSVAGLRIDGYVIVSADGMLADAQHVMPDELKFEGDKRFFTAALDRADLIVHGRHSYEDQPNSPQRKRISLTRSVAATAPDPANPNALLW